LGIGLKLGWRVGVVFRVAIPVAEIRGAYKKACFGGTKRCMGPGLRYGNGRLVGMSVRMLLCVPSSSYDLHVLHCMLRSMHLWPEVGLL